MLIGACNPMLCPIWGFRYSNIRFFHLNHNPVPFNTQQFVLNDTSVMSVPGFGLVHALSRLATRGLSLPPPPPQRFTVLPIHSRRTVRALRRGASVRVIDTGTLGVVVLTG